MHALDKLLHARPGDGSKEAKEAGWVADSLRNHIGLDNYSVAFFSPAKSGTFSGLMKDPLVGKKLKSQHASKIRDPYIIHLNIALSMVVSLFCCGKKHVSNGQKCIF